MVPLFENTSAFARYLFVNEDGHVFSTADKPTSEDLAHAEAGIVTLIDLAELTTYGRIGQWLPIQRGELDCAEIDGRPTRPFHTPIAVGCE